MRDKWRGSKHTALALCAVGIIISGAYFLGSKTLAPEKQRIATNVVSDSASIDSAQPMSVGGYRLVAGDGGIFDFGGAAFYGSMGGQHLNKPVVASVTTATDNGYWEVASDGGIFSFGAAQFHGSMGGKPLNKPVVGMAVDPATGGYWEVASDGGIFSFDAPFYGSMGGKPLNKPIVGMSAMPTGSGYWLVAADGGIFSFGNAQFHGSMGGKPLNKPIVGMSTDAATGGYWEAAATGGIFSFDAAFHGSATGYANSPVIGMTPASTGNGYWIGDAAGQVFAEGIPPGGTMTGHPLNSPIVGFVVSNITIHTNGGAPTTGWNLVFNGVFSGTSLNQAQWQTCYPWESESGCTNFGNPQEREWYVPSQDQVSDGILHLVANKTATEGLSSTGAPKTYAYRSGMVTTYSSFDFTYGYVQVTARIPGTVGTWPALWLLPQTEAWPPEIDMMENYGTGTSAKFSATLHWRAATGLDEQTGKQITAPDNLATGWNTYGMLWQPGSIDWYLNGKLVDSYTGSAVPNQSMYFLANLAINGTAASSNSFDIQSVKIYQQGT